MAGPGSESNIPEDSQARAGSQSRVATWDLVIPNAMERVGEANRELEAFLEASGVGPDGIFPATLAFEEVVTNVIKYSYDDDRPHDILVESRVEPGELILRVTDDGHEFDPLAARPPDLEKPIEERPIGGLGIHLLRRLAQRVEYHRTSGKNVLTLSFSLASGET